MYIIQSYFAVDSACWRSSPSNNLSIVNAHNNILGFCKRINQ